ncbi:hypothetical protein F53441_9220 [Fusarium austroafricanum]|uniref:Peptidase S8/S53 domain-containing protein n=1 Tax=Fusarium austroafricanum TaxID=2364996 RepID=A0A8H4KCW8_9HYPO|nr:hypothetical protein F53441_9220 [Fusarium austroafricanum]
MDKCWFVLSQTHYPPPQESDENGAFKQTGPLCLGHFIKNLKHLDHVINTGGPEPFPLDMPVYRTGPIEFEWESTKEGGFDASIGADVPIAAAPGINAKASLGFALKKTIGNSWQIEQLETLTVEPTRAYINRCLAGEQIAEFLEDNKLGPTWSIFIITGLKIVRGNSTQETSHGREKGINGGPGVGVAGIAEVSVEGGFSSTTSTSTAAKHTHDFVWAVRLSKITKGLFDKKWSKKTYSRGATFDMKESETDIQTMLSDEGLMTTEVLTVEADEAGLEHILQLQPQPDLTPHISTTIQGSCMPSHGAQNMAPSDQAVVSFAVDVTDRLATVARGVGGSEDKLFCPALAAALWLVSQHLKDQKEPDSVHGTRLLKLLSNLERICKPTTSPSLLKEPKNGLELANRYPGLSLLRQNNRKSAVDGVRKLALRRSPEGKKKQQGLLRILETFIKPLTVADETPNPKTKTEVWVGDDFTGSMRTLYKVLSSYIFCNNGSEQTQIAGRLRLALESGAEGDSPAFDLMFLAHPHRELQEESFRWRETRILVDRRKAKFSDANDKEVQLQINGPMCIADFCERISTREQYQLSLKVSDKQLHFVEWCEGARTWVPNTPSVSLSMILRNHKLSQKMKYLLSYLLAKSMWQFYSTDWLGKEWTKESIHFMFERRQNPKDAGIYLNEPFISAHFDPDSSTNDSEFRPHKFPKIKALGIVLLEIELGTVIEDHYDGECRAPDGELNADADLYVALKLFDDPDRLEDTFPLLKSVIGDCLRPSKFMQHRHSVEELRKVLQEEVVDHLHTLIGLYAVTDTTDNTKTSFLSRRASATIASTKASYIDQIALLQLLTQKRPLPVEEYRAVNVKSVASNGAVASCITQASAEAWFEELDELNEVLSCLPSETDQTYKQVRVAVIDTGIDGNDSYAKHIRGYRDFVTNRDDMKQDNTGHGTNSVKLIFKVYAEAEVYVARVFESDEANDDTQDLMLEAIEHAKNVWQVDVISIASGFERDHALMRRAIKRAASDGTVVFAAASNYGNIRQVTFPARMQDVICVYCTDGRAKVSQSINPAAQTTKSRNFAILGEGVSVPPSIREQLTGTSVATSIAAGLAGRLLDFSRQKDCRQTIRCVGSLASVEGISAVFSHMAKGAEDYRFKHSRQQHNEKSQ